MTSYRLLYLASACIAVASVSLQAQSTKPSARAKAPSKAAAPATGSLEGDVYFVTQSGDVKKVASNEVYLLKSNPKLQPFLASACQVIDSLRSQIHMDSAIFKDREESLRKANDLALSGTAEQKALADTATNRFDSSAVALLANMAALVQAKKAFRNSVSSGSTSTAPTGMNAHYRFAEIPVGEYLLFAETKIGSREYQWWKTVAVKPGQSLAVDLDNSSLSEKHYCVSK